MTRSTISRRQLLRLAGAVPALPIIAACGGAPSSPTAAPAKPAESKPAEAAKPTEVPKPAVEATKPAAAAVPTAAPTTAAAKPATTGPKFQGVTLVGILLAGGANEQIYTKFADFEQATGAKVDSSRRHSNDIWDVINREYASGKPSMDFHSGHTILSPVNFHNKPAIQSMIKSEDKADFIPAVMEYMGNKGNVLMLPRMTDVQLMHYRADLFNNPDEQAKFKAKYGRDLKVPESWPDEFLEVAEFFTRPPEMHGFGVAAIHSTFAEWTLSSGGEFMDKNLKAVWNGSKGVEAMNFFRELFQKTFPGGASQWSHLETSEAARQGRLAMWMDWPGNWKQYFDPKVSKVGDVIDIALKPYHKPSGRDKQVVYGGSWAWTFPAKVKNPEASFALIEFIAKPDNQLFEHKASGAVPVRKSIWNEAKQLAAQDKDARTKKRADLLEWTINHFWAYPDRDMPEGNGLRTKHLIPLLQKALLGEMEIAAALNDSAKLVNEGAKELGYKIDG